MREMANLVIHQKRMIIQGSQLEIDYSRRVLSLIELHKLYHEFDLSSDDFHDSLSIITLSKILITYFSIPNNIDIDRKIFYISTCLWLSVLFKINDYLVSGWLLLTCYAISFWFSFYFIPWPDCWTILKVLRSNVCTEVVLVVVNAGS